MSASEKIMVGLAIAQSLVLLGTGLVVLWYTIETAKLRKAMVVANRLTREANLFSTLARVHSALNDHTRYQLRGWLHARFVERLNEAVEAVLKIAPCTDGLPDLSAIQTLAQDGKPTVGAFNQVLQGFLVSANVGALEVVERTLLAFDILATPVSQRIESAWRAAKAYEPVLRDTAPLILPFVAIEGVLRNRRDYKSGYLRMLSMLGILDDLASSSDEGIQRTAKFVRRYFEVPRDDCQTFASG